MQKKMELKPQIRFPEFQEEWKTKLFSDILISSRLGGNYSNSETPNEYPLIKMGNIDRGFIKLDKLDYIDEKEVLNEEDKIKAGDLFFNTRNTLELVGKVAIWQNELPLAYYNSNLMYLEFENNYFMNFCLNSFQGIKKLRSIATGTTSVAAIYSKDLFKLKFTLPLKEEQQKIANFLTAIDNRIQTLEQKKTLLEQYKKGVMQKIFKQELRFKDEKGNEFVEWEYKNGNLLFETISNKNHNSDLPILAISQEFGAIPRELINYNISVTEKSVDSYKVVEKGDFIISLRSFQGGIEYSEYTGICSPAYIILRSKVEIANQFYKTYFKSDYYIKQLCSKLEGIRDGKMISYKYFSEIKIPLPSNEEQIKIANFLSTIDKNIELVTKKIEHTKTYKKGLLQQLFV